jgi:hypothetical protein
MNFTDDFDASLFKGHIKVYRTHKASGKSELVVNKPNTIVFTGADIMARCLGGEENSAISHFYIGYNNSESFSPPPITLYSKASDFSLFVAPFGYLRLPLSWVPSYFNETNYNSNIAVFSTVIATATASGGAAFTSGTSYIYEAGMIAATDPLDPTQDILFNRANFTPILFNSAYNLTIVWAITCRSTTSASSSSSSGPE